MDVQAQIEAELERIERGYGVVPTPFQTLVDRVLEKGPVQMAIGDLIRRKQAGEELDRGPHISVLSDFLAREVDRLSGLATPPVTPASPAELDRVFRECLIDLYGSSFRTELSPRQPTE